ncbi:helix-turn-helix domain-containing protein [Cohnella sp. JJ-181]|uniref:helix-turn-helix domain-containing protein n=1 Tax=Cohnella rhizoplanae TaxID=2974897 RepID=UPI0022FF588C|nr:helix-turn-helix domain-containing protein [Cohnella sp. JJ-181]CAI6080826.1 HTH-type transcriptional activator RhaR [Cohnella sp. JJ-181]
MKLQPLRYFRNFSTTLFLRLMAGFLCIIILLVSLTAYALSVSKNNVRQEIVKYNTLMLDTTMENYEKHFDIIRKQMYLFMFSDRVQKLQREPSYSDFGPIVGDILSQVSNSNLYIADIVFYSKSHNFVIDKSTSTTPDNLFSVFMAGEKYPKSFWDGQFEETYTNRTFPADRFYSHVFTAREEVVGDFIPIIFKRSDNRDFYMAVFLDARRMYEAFHQSLNDDFVIYDREGDIIFERTATGDFPSLSSLNERDGEAFVVDNRYHFYKKGASGMTYMHRLPVAEIVSQTRLNLTLVVLVVAVVLFSVIIALLMAARINNPFKQLVDSIRGTSEPAPYRSSIKEFDLISNQLQDKNKLMKQWAFIHLLKDIRGSDRDAAKLEFSDKPFVFVLFQVVEKKNASWDGGTFSSWLYYMKVFIEDKLNREFPDALTNQVEYNQILSLVFIDGQETLHKLLREMKAVFDQDRDSGTITIAVTSIYDRSDQISVAYREVRDRIDERGLIDETQIIASSPRRQTVIAFAQEEEAEFRANLREGNAEVLERLMDRFFERQRGQELSAAAWLRFAEYVTERIRGAASDQLGAPAAEAILENAEQRIAGCVTVEALERLLREWARRTAEAIEEKKDRKDTIATFVMNYVNEHLSEEIYLDALAAKLNLSSGYLSTYFKDKTGKNFVEYVNETRIERAMSLLVNGRSKIQEVAEAVGYRNIASFNRMFKKYTGLKPSEYRKSMQVASEE